MIIAEDHKPAQDAIRNLIGREYDVICAVCDGQAAVEAVFANPPDVVLLDIAMPVMNGIRAAKILRANHPEVKIVFLSAYAEQAYIDEAFRLGAQGYVLKNSMCRELSLALRAVLAGDIYRPALVARP